MAAIDSPDSPPSRRRRAPAAHRADALMANAIRALAMDAVQQANSGHPGAPMGMAEIAVALWGRHLRHNPANPHWPDRDRFVLSQRPRLDAAVRAAAPDRLRPADRASCATSASCTARRRAIPRSTSRPASRRPPARSARASPTRSAWRSPRSCSPHEFNRDGHAIVDHHTYVFLGDGCLMEGISHEACALAGAWKLDKLIALYDDNGISIDGAGRALVRRRHAEALRGLRLERHRRRRRPRRRRGRRRDRAGATQHRPADADRAARPTIGKGSPNRAGTAKAHGEALGADEIKLTREALGWAHEPFVVPEEAYAAWDAQRARRRRRGAPGRRRFAAYAAAHPELAAEYTRRMARRAAGATGAQTVADAAVGRARARPRRVASRKASQLALEAFTKALPELLGGSADLTGSNLTNTSAHAAAALRRRRRVARRTARPPHQLRRARVRHGGGHERHRAARRLHPVRRHLPDLQRLQPQRDPHGGADEAARDPRLHARLDRPRRGRPDAPVDRARGVAAADPRPRRLAPGRHRRDGWSPGPAAIESRERPTRAAAVAPEPAVRAEGLRRARTDDRARAPTCWPSRRGRPAEEGRRR